MSRLTALERSRRYEARQRGEVVPEIPAADRNERISQSLRALHSAPRPCDGCDAVVSVRVFKLRRFVDDGTHRGRAVWNGSVDLCEDCWRSAQPRCFFCQEPTRNVLSLNVAVRKATQSYTTKKSGEIGACNGCLRRYALRRPRNQGPIGRLRAEAVA